MAKRMIDIGLDDNEDLDISSTDFMLVESTPQHQRQLVLNNKGDFKQNPLVCVGAFDYLDDENFQALIRGISIEFNKDGMDVISINVAANGVINSNAFYK